MYTSSYLEPVCCSMSNSNCCFLTCIQVSQEADQVVWYSHFFQNFPQFIVIHTIRGFSIVNKVEIYDFWNSLTFSMIQWMLTLWSLVPLPFLNPAWAYGISQFKYCWRLAWRNYFGGMWGECNWVVVEHSLKSLFLGIARKRPYQSFRHYWVFQICWHIECST